MQTLTMGQATIVFKEGEEVSPQAIEMATKLERCYAQRSPWKNYRCDSMEDIEELMIDEEFEVTPDIEVYKNHDYVEWLMLDDVKKMIYWGQGDFVIACNFDDCLIEPAQIHYSKPGKVDAIWVGVKPGAVLIYDYDGVEAYITDQEGFIGHYEFGEKTANGETWNCKITSKCLFQMMDERLQQKYFKGEDSITKYNELREKLREDLQEAGMW